MLRKTNNDLDDLATLLECATDTLSVIHYAMEEGNVDGRILANSVFSVYCTIAELTRQIQDRVEETHANGCQHGASV